MTVRLATMEDAEIMSMIHARTWKSAYVNYISEEYLNNITDQGWVPIFRRAFKENAHYAAIAELDGTPTGTVSFGCGRQIGGPDTNEGEIISLYVLPRFWGKKQGYELTRFALERLKIQGYKSCFLWVIKENERAVRFYKRCGFKSTGELKTVTLGGLPVIEEKYRIELCHICCGT